jgi:hypothetical protein
MSKLNITLNFGRSMNMNNIEIKFIENVIIIRTVDNLGFPIDIWRYEKDKLTDLEMVFISNLESATKNLMTEEDSSK